ncbi:E3 ubiquitin-protein ligase CIP8 [Linum grandiflorum]
MISEVDLYAAIMRVLEHGLISTGDPKADEFLGTMSNYVLSNSRFGDSVRGNAEFRRHVGEYFLLKIVTWLRELDQQAMIQEVLVEVNGTEEALRIMGTETEPEPACCVCLDTLDFLPSRAQSVKKTPCNHLFHGDCILNWLLVADKSGGGGTCPICRFQILPSLVPTASSF